MDHDGCVKVLAKLECAFLDGGELNKIAYQMDRVWCMLLKWLNGK